MGRRAITGSGMENAPTSTDPGKISTWSEYRCSSLVVGAVQHQIFRFELEEIGLPEQPRGCRGCNRVAW